MACSRTKAVSVLKELRGDKYASIRTLTKQNQGRTVASKETTATITRLRIEVDALTRGIKALAHGETGGAE